MRAYRTLLLVTAAAAAVCFPIERTAQLALHDLAGPLYASAHARSSDGGGRGGGDRGRGHDDRGGDDHGRGGHGSDDRDDDRGRDDRGDDDDRAGHDVGDDHGTRHDGRDDWMRHRVGS
jgi:hypothetical protein